MKHPRLQPIPGQYIMHHLRLARHSSAAAMLVDASTALDFDALCDAIEAAIEARPDTNADRLERLSNALGLRAHMEDRK